MKIFLAFLRTFCLLITVVLVGGMIATSCSSSVKEIVHDDKAKLTLQKLLTSLENKDLGALKETMSESNEMELILTNGDIMTGADSFVAFHESWFQDTAWSIRHELIDFKLYDGIATSTVKAYYNEPDRDGQPYFHNMVVTYVLHRSEDGTWAVIKDQATSFEKSN